MRHNSRLIASARQMRCIFFIFDPEDQVMCIQRRQKGTRLRHTDIVDPSWIHTWVDFAEKTTLVSSNEYSTPTKFHENPRREKKSRI